MQKTIIYGIVLIIVAIAGYALLLSAKNSGDEDTVVENGTSTTADGRDEWKTASVGDITFRYPEDIGMTYTTLFDWPPEARILSEPYSCTSAGEPSDRAGRTEERVVGGRTYCVTEIVEGAAGSVYTEYAYGFDKGGRTIMLTFSTRQPQCENFDEPERTACTNEEFDPDALIHEMASTLTVD